ncbi:MAG: 2-oxoacid:acceptor oxidoreductase subunit alpha [Gemmatimonadetes bacterium]|jgi:2-oxoglutarate/2-oxoacid ferredoxin oxidoreductase subunit alpha|nr:2-oxoacid:acceptor oxidoreductase subunit alpha [Gemmatimonadota bacterium]MBT6147037.1 2-oxoacid:acceptor oxidoreductase subunit alpha [Gemmatimonadota bacterium]MBT7862209.1 2-oxoacid:acceptor oxidoreductase subunit alpha [Gemmatimonadota bacterium]
MAEPPASESSAVDGESARLMDSVVIRFSGDSGDGMQLTGDQFTNTSAVLGNDISTFPDFPAEIRAPAGTLAGLSGFQVNLAATDIYTAGDAPRVLVAMNPAALAANLADLEPGGVIIANEDAYTRNNLRKAGYEANPLDDESYLQGYELHRVPLTSLTRAALEDLDELSNQQKDLCKNAFALGLAFWLFDRPLETTLAFYREKFGKRPQVVEANTRALKAGYAYGETTEAFQSRMSVPTRTDEVPPGTYRRITGNEAVVLGLVTAAQKANRTLFYGSYPITPATPILEGLAALKRFDVRTFQAEDEIAAIGSVIGGAFAGALSVTASSGPGVSLKSEGMNLAIVLELPMVVVNVQRGGPSTGLPTKTEQADLLSVLYGRNGESPIPVIAAATAADCFDMAIEACRIALRHMTPVFLLTDGYLANSSEPWRLPDLDMIEPIPVENRTDPNGYQPYMRDEATLARPWVLPGTVGMAHRIGGLGKQDVTGNVSYDPHDNEHMIKMRAEKVARIADFLPPLDVLGPEQGDLLVVGWGGTYGAIRAAVEQAQSEGRAVASCHLRHLNPFPKDLGNIMSRYRQVLVPELNLGQLSMLLQARYPVRVIGLNKVQGQPFRIREIVAKINEILT